MSKYFSLAIPNVVDAGVPSRELFQSLPDIPEYLCSLHQYAGQRSFVFIATHSSGRYSVNEDAFKLLTGSVDYVDCDAILYSKMRNQGVRVAKEALSRFFKSGNADYIDRSRAGAFYAFNHESIVKFCENMADSEQGPNWTIKSGKFSLPELTGDKDTYNSTIRTAAPACEKAGLLLAVVDPINFVIYPLKDTVKE